MMDSSLARIQPCTAVSDESFAGNLLTGLAKTPKEIACKYFYDAVGSHLFEQICELPEYYQTRTEMALLSRHADEIASLMGESVEILEFGAGSLRKVRILLDAARTPYAYTPLDISGDYLQEVVRALAAEYPALVLRPVVGDFTCPLEIPDLPGRNAKISRRAGFFPGSTIGNFKPDAAMALLRQMRASLNGGGLLIGVDLVKDPVRLHAAYNDAAGITARFNLNVLTRMNRELNANFDLASFSHHAFYNSERHRIEMHLASNKRQKVKVAGRVIEFRTGETIHTENSYKYTLDSFTALARGSGWSPLAVWTDAGANFSVHALSFDGA
jgi:dimethylhistidine N-methyltransferase